MSKLRVMMLVHTTLVPPEDLVSEDDPRMEEYRTEYDVKSALLKLKHVITSYSIHYTKLYDPTSVERRHRRHCRHAMVALPRFQCRGRCPLGGVMGYGGLLPGAAHGAGARGV